MPTHRSRDHHFCKTYCNRFRSVMFILLNPMLQDEIIKQRGIHSSLLHHIVNLCNPHCPSRPVTSQVYCDKCSLPIHQLPLLLVQNVTNDPTDTAEFPRERCKLEHQTMAFSGTHFELDYNEPNLRLTRDLATRTRHHLTSFPRNSPLDVLYYYKNILIIKYILDAAPHRMHEWWPYQFFPEIGF